MSFYTVFPDSEGINDRVIIGCHCGSEECGYVRFEIEDFESFQELIVNHAPPRVYGFRRWIKCLWNMLIYKKFYPYWAVILSEEDAKALGKWLMELKYGETYLLEENNNGKNK